MDKMKELRNSSRRPTLDRKRHEDGEAGWRRRGEFIETDAKVL